MKLKKSLAVVIAAGMAGLASAATSNNLVVQTNKPGAEIQPTMYGLFFEDINYAADGGLYAELIKNRSFEFPQAFMGWNTYGGVELRNDGPFDRNPHYVRLSTAGHSDKHTGIENEGFFGVGVKAGEEYRFSMWARVPEGGKAKLKVLIVDPASMANSQNMAQADVTVDSREWK
ncbi:MAG: carbohydrate binding domain-containing protein, partial [Muribaculaceae bacterium]|nr:carbohydrate binding domain-containing protein [Muribaculaceae bacterium]